MDVKMLTYLHSENEFSRASQQGFWEVVRSFFTHRNAHLLSFNEVLNKFNVSETTDLGIQDVPLKKIVGSTGRCAGFTRHFLPRMHDQFSKERWRNIYMLAVSGRGFPPIEVYKVGQVYFVEDGHHRVSVAAYLNWKTIRAHVTEIPLGFAGETNFYDSPDWQDEVDLRNN